ncbi:hypothetical protein GCM10010172_87620 [Paractinoplanes ferrugineus]|uniref:AAA+ ATPase domain-containing protein n=1 Tax=Paractinoplanes ferrugineus TaxID=113564 RepID=A0A919JB06_9ACTN|nr:P-loop NTPase fold protein [Actinoplanes ferrugineus]GIE16537.1 hypothetical protein Afe05nite_83770 [Actinoplanes ferrugineus]
MAEVWDEHDLNLEAVARVLLVRRGNDLDQPTNIHETLAGEVAARSGVIAERVAPELRAVRAARQRCAAARTRPWLPTGLAVASLIGTLVCFTSSFASGFGDWQILLSLALLIFTAGMASLAGTRHLEVRGDRRQLKQAQQALAAAAEDAVGELLRERILERTEPTLAWGNTFKSTFAPTLVGIGVDNAIPSASYTELVEFIAQHSTSAIGIAGPRGVGKSTLMEKIIHERRLRPIGVRVPAPKRYEPGALIRLVHSSLAHEVLHPGVGRLLLSEPTGGRLAALRRLVASVLVLLSAIAVVVIWANDQARLSERSESSGWRVSTVTVLCIAAAGALLGILARVLWLAGWAMRPEVVADLGARSSRDREVRALARRELEHLRYSSATQAKNSVSWKLGFINGSGEDQLTLTERALSDADAVARLREFCTELARTADQPIIVAIDELDKMDQPSDVVAVINSLKDLFHLRRLHVLVSVSTDAMHSFAARGILVRDVFDSAFDTIVEVRRLETKESRSLLSRRATQFSVPAMYFCHCWSGGHPRDLVRTARACVTIAARAERDATQQGMDIAPEVRLAEVVDAVLVDDVAAVLQATADRVTADHQNRPQQSDDPGRPSARQDEAIRAAEDLIALRDLLIEGTGPVHQRINDALSVAELPTLSGPVTEGELLVRALDSYLKFAQAVSKFFARERMPDQWQDTATTQAVRLLAEAQPALSRHPGEARRAIERAVVAINGCPSTP